MQDEVGEDPNLANWYVAQCKSLREKQTAQAIRAYLELDVYLPEVSMRVRGNLELRPLFPGYLFVQADLRKVSTGSINSMPGVMRLLEFGGVTKPLPHEAIHAMRERVDALNHRGGLLPHSFQPGDAVRIKAGPLRGLEAVFLGPMTPSARVNVLLQFLGRPNEVKVDVDTLERAGGNDRAQIRERGTRGHGRRINAKK